MGDYNCILCRAPKRTLSSLVYHIRETHGREARRAYKRGRWEMSGTKSVQDNLFAAVDALAAEEAAEQKEIAGQQEIASIPKGDEPNQPPPTGRVEVATVSGIVPPLTDEQPQPSFIEPKADLIYGATGSGKTANVGEVSDYVLAKWGKLTRMVSADGGGFGPLKGKVKSGQIEYWALNAWKNPVANLERAIQGYWPLRLDDPDSPVVPPDAGTWEVYGFGAFEGLTSFGDMILDSLSGSKASLSQDPSFTWVQDGIEFSGENMSYYGFMQKELQRKVALSHLLRYEKVLWTAQESKGEEKGGGFVYGPMIGGKKATAKAGGWFLNVFHMDIIPGPQQKDEKTGQFISGVKHVLFLKTHIDPYSPVPFPCKTREPKIYRDKVPSYLESGSVADAYRLLDGLYELQEKESDSKLAEIKGLKEKLMAQAAAAKKREAAEAEKRAKAAGMLKPMVSVPSLPTLAAPATGAVPVGVKSPPLPPTPKPAGGPVPVAPSVSATIPTIQNVRKKT